VFHLCFGITRPARTWNQYGLIFNIYGYSLPMLGAENWKDKFTIWFKPTGWRPEILKKNIQ
jgi:hypothetical protein